MTLRDVKELVTVGLEKRGRVMNGYKMACGNHVLYETTKEYLNFEAAHARQHLASRFFSV